MKKKGYSNLEKFRVDSLKKTGVSFCTRDHFGTPDPKEDQKYTLDWPILELIEIKLVRA